MKASIFAVLSLVLVSSALADGSPTGTGNTTSPINTVTNPITAPITTKINSFTHIGDQNSPLGEVCGTVTINDTTTMPAQGNVIPVTVTSDPGTNNPGMYTVLVDRTGNFCVLIATYNGTASAEAWTPGAKFGTSVAVIDHPRRAN
jgi:hypothetical protein